MLDIASIIRVLSEISLTPLAQRKSSITFGDFFYRLLAWGTVANLWYKP